jgi:hypothetical protein
MAGRQPATEPDRSHRSAVPYRVLTGAEAEVTRTQRARAALGIVVLGVALGAGFAVVVGLLVVVAGVLVSAAVS